MDMPGSKFAKFCSIVFMVSTFLGVDVQNVRAAVLGFRQACFSDLDCYTQIFSSLSTGNQMPQFRVRFSLNSCACACLIHARKVVKLAFGVFFSFGLRKCSDY